MSSDTGEGAKQKPEKQKEKPPTPTPPKEGERMICVVCRKKVVHPARKYAICLDCIVEILIRKKFISGLKPQG